MPFEYFPAVLAMCPINILRAVSWQNFDLSGMAPYFL